MLAMTLFFARKMWKCQTCVKFISNNKVHLSRINWTLTKLSLTVAANVCAIRRVSAVTERYEILMFQYWAIIRGISEILSQFILPTFSHTSRSSSVYVVLFFGVMCKNQSEGENIVFTNVQWRRRRRRELSAFPFTNFGDFTSQLKLSHLLVLCVATIKTQQKLPRKLNRVSRRKRKTRIYMENFFVEAERK